MITEMQLNYRHLRYFQEIAREENLTRAAERLNISQSALSIQVKQLEERLGHMLFDRTGKRMVLTEAGRIALDHANRIFAAGDDLLATLEQRTLADTPLRIGALSTLSRNFQIQFLEPLLAKKSARIALRSGDLDTLFSELSNLAIDMVLTTEAPELETKSGFRARLIDSQPVALIGEPALVADKSLEELLENVPLIVPTDNAVRSGLSRLSARLNVTPKIAAEVDDMAMVRLLARSGAGVALAPTVVLADEIHSGTVVLAPHDLGITEEFYAVTTERLFPHPLLEVLWPEDRA